METMRTMKHMTNRTCSFLVGIAFSLATCSVSHAMSQLVSITMEPEWPATSQPGTVVLYKISAVVREGQGLLEVSLSCDGLPEGTTVTFSPSVLRFTGRTPTTQSALMTVTCASLTPTDGYPFTVTGQALRESITITNQTSVKSRIPPTERPVLFLDPPSGGSLKIRGQGASGQTYQIEGTSDLGHPAWSPLGSSTADGNGRFSFFPADATNSPMRFYRTVWQAPVVPPQQ